VTEIAKDSIRARADSVAPLPDRTGFKSILCRAVQICKRHRDFYFETRDPLLAPISVIVTTLLSRSYEACVKTVVYESEFDLLLDVVKRMPEHIDQFGISGSHWNIRNETTTGENFAEKWNRDPRLVTAFFGWHVQAVADIEVLKTVKGLDQIEESLGRSFGKRPVTKAMEAFTHDLSKARNAGTLSVAPVVGLIANAGAVKAATGVRKNTFFGGR
jgi:hypothetical protein